MGKDLIVLPSSELAAQYVENIRGWVSRHGRFYGDNQDSEELARYDGCTHTNCKTCGNSTQRGWLLCNKCQEKSDAEQYKALPIAEWDGKAMLYSQANHEYYCSPDEAEDSLEEDQSLDDLQLVICKPNYIELSADYFDHVTPEEGGLPDGVVAAIEKFNESVRGIEISWSPGRQRLVTR